MIEEKLKLIRVTCGKYHSRNLVFHFVKDDLNHEFQIKRIHSNSLNLRLVWPLRKYLKIDRCIRGDPIFSTKNGHKFIPTKTLPKSPPKSSKKSKMPKFPLSSKYHLKKLKMVDSDFDLSDD